MMTQEPVERLIFLLSNYSQYVNHLDLQYGDTFSSVEYLQALPGPWVRFSLMAIIQAIGFPLAQVRKLYFPTFRSEKNHMRPKWRPLVFSRL